MPFRHAFVTAVLSTAVFMVEPPARREIIVVYTWWRVVESMLGNRLAIVETNDLASADQFKAESLAAAAMVGVAAGCCQTWV